jgi:hypothetical protein
MDFGNNFKSHAETSRLQAIVDNNPPPLALMAQSQALTQYTSECGLSYDKPNHHRRPNPLFFRSCCPAQQSKNQRQRKPQSELIPQIG